MTEVVPAQTRLSDDDLERMSSYADVAAYATEAGLAAVDVSDYGTGVELLDKNGKNRLVGVEFLILDWQWRTGDFAEEGYVSLTLMTKDGSKYVLNDGSTGIREDVRRLERKIGGKAIVKVGKGLSRGDYTYVAPDGTETPATTYRLNFSK